MASRVAGNCCKVRVARLSNISPLVSALKMTDRDPARQQVTKMSFWHPNRTRSCLFTHRLRFNYHPPRATSSSFPSSHRPDTRKSVCPSASARPHPSPHLMRPRHDCLTLGIRVHPRDRLEARLIFPPGVLPDKAPPQSVRPEILHHAVVRLKIVRLKIVRLKIVHLTIVRPKIARLKIVRLTIARLEIVRLVIRPHKHPLPHRLKYLVEDRLRHLVECHLKHPVEDRLNPILKSRVTRYPNKWQPKYWPELRLVADRRPRSMTPRRLHPEAQPIALQKLNPKLNPKPHLKAGLEAPQDALQPPPPNDLPSLRGPYGYRRPNMQNIFRQISMGRLPSQCENPRNHAPQFDPPLVPAAEQQPHDPVQRRSRTRITPMPGPEPSVQTEDPHQFFHRMSKKLMEYFTDKIEPPPQKEFDAILDEYALAKRRIERRETVEDSKGFLLMHCLPDISEDGHEPMVESPKLKQTCMEDCNAAYGYILIPPDGFVSEDLAELFTCGSLVPITDGMADPNFYAYTDKNGVHHYRCWCPTHQDMCVVLHMYDVDPNEWNETKAQGGSRARWFLRRVFDGTGVQVLKYQSLMKMTDRFYRKWWDTFWETERDIYRNHELIPANDEYWKNEAEFFREEPR